MTTTQRLSDIRQQIDQIDEQIQLLIEQRAECAVQVAALKRQLEKDPVYYRPERESQILQARLQHYNGILDRANLTAIYRAIMTACLTVQQRQKVAFLGPLGTFSHGAVSKHFGDAADLLPVASIDQVFREIMQKNAYYGVVPIENSITGIINQTLDSLINSALTICGEINLPIQQNLLGLAENLQAIECIYSHEQSLAQSRNWLAQHLPGIQQIPVNSNAEAARLAAQNPKAVAVAGERAAEIYKLKIMVAHIEDNPQNSTRFLLIGEQQVPPSGNDKTSLLIKTAAPDALIQLLKPFADLSIQVNVLASRTYRQRGSEQIFFMEIAGHQQDEDVKQALAIVAKQPVLVQVLGSYPKAF